MKIYKVSFGLPAGLPQEIIANDSSFAVKNAILNLVATGKIKTPEQLEGEVCHVDNNEGEQYIFVLHINWELKIESVGSFNVSI